MVKSIGEKIKYYRKKLGWTLQELEEKSGIANPSLSRYETGKVIPRREALEKLAKALNVPVEEFLQTEEEPEEKPKPEINNREKELELFKSIFKDLLMDVSVKVPVYGTVGDKLIRKIVVYNPDSTEVVKERFKKLLGPSSLSRFAYEDCTFKDSIKKIKDIYKK